MEFVSKTSREENVALAKIAEAAERYEEMKEIMRFHAKEYPKFSVEERNLLSVAYKNVVGSQRNKIENEMKSNCLEAINLIQNYLKPDGSESKVFYSKAKGDYCRYLSDREPEKYKKKCEDAYDEAQKIMEEELPITHPIRLGMTLSWCAFTYEILGKPSKAYEIAKKTFDEAITKLDELDEETYKDATVILQLLRDNLTLWSAPDESQEEKDQYN